MPSNYQYRPRSAEDWDRRANQKGREYIGIFQDDVPVFQPAKGSNSVRFFPPTWDQKDAPWMQHDHYGLDVFVHNQVGPGKATILCLREMKGKKCPICEEHARAQANGEDKEVLRELSAGKRVVAWVLDKKKGAEAKPMLWAMPFAKIDKVVAKLAKDRTTGKVREIDHPDRGYDVFFDKEGEGLGTDYTGVEISHEKSAVPERHMKYVIANPIPDCLQWFSYAEIKEMFEGGQVGDSSGDEEEEQPKRRSRQPEPEEEEEEQPRRRSRQADPDEDEEDEEEQPKRRSSRNLDPDEDEEEEEQPKRRADPDEEEEPRSTRRGSARKAEPEDEEEEQPKRRRAAREEPEPDPDPPAKERPSGRARLKDAPAEESTASRLRKQFRDR